MRNSRVADTALFAIPEAEEHLAQLAVQLFEAPPLLSHCGRSVGFKDSQGASPLRAETHRQSACATRAIWLSSQYRVPD